MLLAHISKVSDCHTDDINLALRRKRRQWKLHLYDMYGELLVNKRSYSPYLLYVVAKCYCRTYGDQMQIMMTDNGEGLRYDTLQPCEIRDHFMSEEDIEELRRLREEAIENGEDSRNVEFDKRKGDDFW